MLFAPVLRRRRVERGVGRRFPPAFLLYVVVLGGLVASALPAALPAARAQLRDTVFLLVLMTAASLITIPIMPDLDVDGQLDGPVAVAAAVLLPPPLAMAVAFLGFTNHRELRLTASPWTSLFNRSQIALSVGLAALAALPVQGELGLGRRVLATVLALVVYSLASLVLWRVGHSLLHRSSLVEVLRVPPFPVDFLLVSALALPLVVLYQAFSSLAVLLLAFPMGLGYSAIRSACESEDKAQQLGVQVRELSTLNALAKQLLVETDVERVLASTRGALAGALGTEEVVVDLGGEIPADLQSFAVPGARPAAVGVPRGLPEGSVAAVDAVAGLLGMSLQRAELFAELGALQQARVALSGEILEEGTRERSRIALEIHDNVLPYFAAAEIQADNVRSWLRRAEPDRAEGLTAITQDAIHGGIGRLREVLDQLRKQIIVPGSLREGLRQGLGDLKLVHGVEGRLEVPETLPPLPLAVEILVLETVRGCLANVAKHAGARHVTVALEFTDSGISASVCDDGRGFDPARISQGSHGLSLMAQRVDLARGRFLINSSVGQGTRVHVEVPL